MRMTEWLLSLRRRYSFSSRRSTSRRKPGSWNKSYAIVSFEPRVLLSVTAVNDTATIKGAGPVTFDVLANDHSASGGLALTAVFNVTHGSAQLIDSDADGRNDRVLFSPTPGYTGAAGFGYMTQDAAGAIASASVSLTVASAAPRLAANASGQLDVVGGLGGTGYRADAQSSYTPDVSGNFSQSASLSDDNWHHNVLIADDSVPATGPQGLSQTTTSTYTDSSNWSFAEAVTWTYDTSATNAAGDTHHSWGGYNYTFTVTMLAGVKTTAFVYLATDRYTTTTTSQVSSGVYTTIAEGTQQYRLEIANIDSPTGLDTGWHLESTSVAATDRGTGQFSYALEGGGVSGSLYGQGANLTNSVYTISHVQDAVGRWHAAGVSSFTGSGSRFSGWQGSGPYGNDTFRGSVTKTTAAATIQVTVTPPAAL